MAVDNGREVSQEQSARYADSNGVDIAYQVVGEGPIDLVFVQHGNAPVDLIWDLPIFARSMRRLASFCRVILIDLRGWGSSERIALDEMPTMQAWMDDILAVMDTVGVKTASLMAASEGGLPCMLLAASHPERVSALVLANCYARFKRSPDQPWGMPANTLDEYVAASIDSMRRGGDGIVANVVPSVVSDTHTREWFARAGRLGNAPRSYGAIFRVFAETDVTDLLPGINVPTLVLHRRDARHVKVEHGRFLAERIPNAKYIELPGEDSFPFVGESDDLIDEVEEFLTGARQAADIDRVLATVLFTDIVRSTEQLAGVGDRRWRDLLDAHDTIVRRQLDVFRGRWIEGTGDGVLATFDGPARAIRCAAAIREGLRSLQVDVRAGLHTGEIELRQERVGGIAVHIAARVGAMAASGELLVSRTVKDLVAGSGIAFTDRGMHALKGVPDEWQLYAAEP
jgi:pimeloyl-ACP methyl ester carboxylesterase